MKLRYYKLGDPRIKTTIKRLTDAGVNVGEEVDYSIKEVTVYVHNKYLSEHQTRLLLHLNFGEHP